MTAATDLWAAVVVSYDTDSLVSLTNIHNRAALTITTSVGEDAALGAINIWAIYAEADYDQTNTLHVEIGKRATIAMLWERGGSAVQIARQEWDEVFTDGLIERLKNTGPRGRQGPSSSGPDTGANGQELQPWSARESMPPGFLPSRRSVIQD